MCLRFWGAPREKLLLGIWQLLQGSCCLSNTPSLLFVSLQELIDVDSEVVFELASYILQVGSSPRLTTPRRRVVRLSAQPTAIPLLGASSSLAIAGKELLGTLHEDSK